MKEFKVGTGTFTVSSNNSKTISLHWLIALLPLLIFSIIKNGLLPALALKINIVGLIFPVLFLLTGLVAALLTDLISRQVFKIKEEINYFSSILIGLILTSILPISTPLLLVALASSLAIISKYIMLKVFKKQVINPVIIGFIIVMLAYLFKLLPSVNYLNPNETGMLPLAKMLSITGIGDYNLLVKPYGSLLDFFLGLIPGGIASTSFVICLVSYLYLSIKKAIKWRIPLIVVGTVFALTYMIGEFSNLDIWYALFNIFSGSLLFISIFIASNNETTPVTAIGEILYALFLGILIVALRYFIPITNTILIAILIVSLFNGLFDYIGSISRINFNRSIGPFIVTWLLILILGTFLGIHYAKDKKASVSTQATSKINILI